MSSFLELLRAFSRDRYGLSMVEYALIVAVIALAIAGAGNPLAAVFNGLANAW
jgi:Flp pilus assembly pilin Flp